MLQPTSYIIAAIDGRFRVHHTWQSAGRQPETTADNIAAFRFPAGDAGNVRGFDGHLESDSSGFSVPAGVSYWELKTSGDAWGEGAEGFP